MPNSQLICRVCNSGGNHQKIIAREMMFGTKEEFEYFQCEVCDCLQIKDIPADLSRFYPPTYYSFNSNDKFSNEIPFIRRKLEQLRAKNAIFGRGYKLAKIAEQFVPFPQSVKNIGHLIKKCKPKSFSSRFLDVGCGSSSWWLNELKSIGFSNLLGIDPYIQNDFQDNGITILSKQIKHLDGSFDIITLHHSLEHIHDQIDTLKTIHSLLSPNGVCLIRIPLVSSTVWEEYGTDWIELDAPRHLYLHSLKSIEIVAKKAGLKIIDRCWDSTEFEFLGSEQYRRGISFAAENSFIVNPSNSNFTYREVANFKNRAEAANKSQKGGRGCFFLQSIQL